MKRNYFEIIILKSFMRKIFISHDHCRLLTLKVGHRRVHLGLLADLMVDRLLSCHVQNPHKINVEL